MRLFQRKTEHTASGNKSTNVLPGIIATVVDDKNKKVYIDLDLELEPEETSKPQTIENIPPGLVATVKKSKNFWPFDIQHFLKKHITKVILLSCALVGAVSIAIAAYLMYAMPVSHKTSYPVAKPLEPLDPISVRNQLRPRSEPEKSEAQQYPSDQDLEQEHRLHTASEGILSSIALQTTPSQPTTVPHTQKQQAADSENHISDTSRTKPALSEQGSSSPQEIADYYLYAGYVCETRNNLAGALEWYKKAALVTPNDARLLNKIAFLLIKLSIYDEAARYAEKALALQHDYVPALVNMGIICAHQGKLDEASHFLESALQLDNTSTSALYNLMLLCRKQGNYTRAEDIERKLKALGHTEQQ